MSVKIIGTGHILQKSVEEVRNAILGERPDIVAVELDYNRFKALEDVNFLPEAYRTRISFKGVLSASVRGGSFPVFIQGILALIQQDLGEKYGISPGSDMCAAILSAREIGARIALIDRDIGITMNRVLRVPLREVLALSSSKEEDLEDLSKISMDKIEDILEKDNLELIIRGFKRKQPSLFSALVDERDKYMADMLEKISVENPEKKIIAIVGAGHLGGLTGYLESLQAGSKIDTAPLLEQKKISVFRMIGLLAALFFSFILFKLKSLSFSRNKKR
jgi:pheromone shutdown-related protein TraB